MLSHDMIKITLQTVYDLGREHGNVESWQPDSIDLDDFEDDAEITLTNSTLKTSLREAAETEREEILESLRVARHNCSPFYADGLDHALDIISGKLD